MNKFFFLIIFIFSSSFQLPNFKEKLDIIPLKEFDKSLLHFTFDFQHPLSLNQIIVKNSLWPRALLEQLFLFSKVKYLQIQMATGGLHPQLKQQFEFELPEEGTKFFINSDCDYEKAIIYMSEIFGITRKNFMEEFSFYLNVDESLRKIALSQNNNNNNDWQRMEVIYGNDPTDFFCVDNLVLLKKLLGCEGKKGVAILLDSNNIFRAGYNSHKTIISYDEINQEVNIHIEYNVIISPSKRAKYFQHQQKIPYCPIYNSSELLTPEKRVDLKESGKFPFNFVELNSSLEYQFKRNQAEVIEPKTFINGEWFSSDTVLFHEFQNKQNQVMKFQLDIFLPFFLRPKMNKLRIIEIDNNGQISDITQKTRIKLTLNKDDYNGRRGYQQIILLGELNSKASIQISLGIQKLMKSFEDYPHDPGKGYFIIATPLIYSIGKGPIEYVITNNVLTKIPEPDFSMPFNILTFTMALFFFIFLLFFFFQVSFGYLFISIYRLSVDKDKQHWIEGRKLSKFEKIINYLKRFV